MGRAREPAELATGYDSGNLFGMKNRIINGDMRIDQRNAGASVTPTEGQYTVDRWQARLNQSSKFSVQQNAGAVTPPDGFTKYLGVTSLSSYSVLSSDYFGIQQNIEGFNTADLNFGTANAKAITVSFWVRSSLTGAFPLTFINDGFARGYVTTYTISAANTWEYKTVTIAGDTTGTWLTNSSAGLRLWFTLGAGSGQAATPNAWGSFVGMGVTGAVNLVGTNGATFYITGVQLERGSTATSFDFRPYGTELMLCQRYCEVVQAVEDGQRFALSGNGTTTIFPTYFFKVTKRAAPTLTVSAAGDFKKESYASGNATASSVGSNRANIDSLTFSVATANTDAGGNLLANNANAKVTFSSEL